MDGILQYTYLGDIRISQICTNILYVFYMNLYNGCYFIAAGVSNL